jgi:hypothetical protein
MAEQREFVRRLVELLESAQIPYMVAGSLASSFHGHPRATNDVDFVIAPTESQLRCFLNILGTGYYVSEEAALAALRRGSAFNVIDMDTQWKADLRVRSGRPFSLMEFDRRQKAPVLGLDVCVVSAEDVILSKLEWARESGSTQQLDDALGVLQAQQGSLDEAHLMKWAEELGVRDRLIELLEQAKAEREQCDREP